MSTKKIMIETSQQYTPKNALLADLFNRGYIYQATNLEELDKLLEKKRLNGENISAYIGFDCTAQSLHVGSLMQIMILRRLQQHGHTPIVLMGGATTLIGDPSDKQEMRKMLSAEEIEKNMNSIAKIFHKTLKFSGKNAATIVNNLEWLGKLNYLELLRNYGAYFSVNRMLSFDSVRLRLEREQPLTFLEFNYMILQGYDFIELYNRSLNNESLNNESLNNESLNLKKTNEINNTQPKEECILQFGGSDQWGNIVNGIDLGRRVYGAELYGITTNLITTSDGKKMGKTANGAVWLNEDMLNSYDFWQFWRNVDDRDVKKFLKIYTDFSIEECDKLGSLEKDNDINKAKILLANSVTEICHGIEAAKKAEKTAQEFFIHGKIDENLPIIEFNIQEFNNNNNNINQQFLNQQSSSFTSQTIIPLYLLLCHCNLANSNGEARKLIRGGGIRINNEKITDEYWNLNEFIDKEKKNEIILSIGRKKIVKIKIVNN